MRARNIKPGFFANEDLAECSPLTRILFAGLWCLADREGRMEDRPKRIRAELLPYDACDADQLLDELEAHGFITRYAHGEHRFIQVLNFCKHQMPHHKEVASVIPAPEGRPQITRHAYDVSAQTRLEVFRRDGGQCLKCGSTDRLSLDHIIPLACGGDNSITNLQTLCTSCNSSKGGTTKDYRKTNVDPTLIQRQSNDGVSCPPDSLIPDSLIPEEEHVDASASTPAEPTSQQTASVTQFDRIPYEQIRELYNQILGGKLKRCMGLNDTHRKHIRACMNLQLEGRFVAREGGLDFWEGLFNDVLACPFMLGANARAWKADFEFLTTSTKIQRFLEGKYDAA